MPIPRPAACQRGAPSVLAAALTSVLAVVLAACGTTPTDSAQPSGSSVGGPSATPLPTSVPTPFFSNVPDPALIALIPTELAGRTVTIPPIADFGLTPGDIGEVYGEIGVRFRSLQLVFIGRPHLLSLYAVRMDPAFATTNDLEPYLAAAGEYVGVAGLHREPWTLRVIGGHLVWARPGDDAMITGATVYAWATQGFLFLMVGVEQAQDAAMIAALPGEAGPGASPSAGGSPARAGG